MRGQRKKHPSSKSALRRTLGETDKRRMNRFPPHIEASEHDMVMMAQARRDLVKYLCGVLNDSKAEPRRRDEMAASLSKVLVTAQPRIGPRVPAKDKPTGERKGPTPRTSVYVSKKAKAQEQAKTAHKGSPWNGLVNGSAGARDGDDEDEE